MDDHIRELATLWQELAPTLGKMLIASPIDIFPEESRPLVLRYREVTEQYVYQTPAFRALAAQMLTELGGDQGDN